MEINKNQLDIYYHILCGVTNEENMDADSCENHFIELCKIVNEYIKEENNDNML